MRTFIYLFHIIAATIVLLVAERPLTAQQFYVSSANPRVVSVVGVSDVTGMFINWIHSEASLSFDAGSSPASFDANGFPNIAPIGATVYNEIQMGSQLQRYSGTWEYGFTGTGARYVQGVGITIASGGDPQNCCHGSSSCNVGEVYGTNCHITFTFNATAKTQVNLQFVTGRTYTNMGGEFLVRTTDYAAYLAGKILTPEFSRVEQIAWPLAIRTLGLSFPVQQEQNCASWTYRTPTTSGPWIGGTWFPAAWSPSITGTDQYIATGATNTPATWTDQEVLQGNFANASNPAVTVSAASSDGGLVRLTVNSTATLTTNQNVLAVNTYSQVTGENLQAPHVYAVTVIDGTHIDLQGTTYSSKWAGGGQIITTTIDIYYNGSSRGPKFILNVSGLGAPGITAAANVSLFYDATLDVVLAAVKEPIICGMPFEEQAELANEIGRPLWLNISPFWRTADVTSMVAYYNANLNSDLYLEVANENWNPIFSSFQYFYQNGYRIGLPLSSSNALLSYVGLLDRQFYPVAITAWSSGARSRPRSTLHLVSAGQAEGSPTLYNTYQYSGSTLCGTSCSNAAYQSAVGTDYNVSPNRPEDFIDDYSAASYFNGAQENGPSGAIGTQYTLAELTGTCNGTSCTGLIAASACFAAPSNATCGTGGSAQLAFQFIDNDNRNGLMADGSGSCAAAPVEYTIYCRDTAKLNGWVNVAVGDSKKFVAYEGGFSSFGPTAAYLISICGASNCYSDGTTVANNISNLIIAYRNTQLFYTTYVYQNSDLFGLASAVVGNSQLQVEGSVITPGEQAWFLLSGDYFSAPYQNYYAMRDIDAGNQ